MLSSSLSRVMKSASSMQFRVKSVTGWATLQNRINAHSNRNILHSVSALHFSSKPTGEVDSSMKGKLTSLWTKYGFITIGTYFGLYALTLGSVFSSLEFDIFNAATFGLDPVLAVQKFCDIVEFVTGSTALPGYIRANPSVGTFAIAWVMTKFTEPARVLFTIYSVPKIARALGRAPPLKS